MPSPLYCSLAGVEMANPLLRLHVRVKKSLNSKHNLKNYSFIPPNRPRAKHIGKSCSRKHQRYQIKTTGQLRVAAKLKAPCASPSEADPSPK